MLVWQHWTHFSWAGKGPRTLCLGSALCVEHILSNLIQIRPWRGHLSAFYLRGGKVIGFRWVIISSSMDGNYQMLSPQNPTGISCCAVSPFPSSLWNCSGNCNCAFYMLISNLTSPRNPHWNCKPLDAISACPACYPPLAPRYFENMWMLARKIVSISSIASDNMGFKLANSLSSSMSPFGVGMNSREVIPHLWEWRCRQELETYFSSF